MEKPKSYIFSANVNGQEITELLIGRHYLKKHSAYMNDDLILQLAKCLDGKTFPVDSSTSGIDYYAADIEYGDPSKIYRLIWLFEGDKLEVLGGDQCLPKKKEN